MAPDLATSNTIPSNKKHKTAHGDNGNNDDDDEEGSSAPQQRCTLCGYSKPKSRFVPNWGKGVDTFLKGMCRPCTDKLYGRKTTALSCLQCERPLLMSSSGDDDVPDDPPSWLWGRLLRRPYQNVTSRGCSECFGERAPRQSRHRSHGGELIDTDDEEGEAPARDEAAAAVAVAVAADAGQQQQQQQQQRTCGKCRQMKSRPGYSTTQWTLMTAVEQLRDEHKLHKEHYQERRTRGNISRVAFYSYPYTFYEGLCSRCLPPEQESEACVDENWKRDKALVMALRKKYGVGIYDFRPLLRNDERSLSCMFQRHSGSVLDLDGTYDVLLFREESEGQEDGDICSQRAAARDGMSLGVLELVSSTPADADGGDYEDGLRGTLTIPNSPAWGDLSREKCNVSFTNRLRANGRQLCGSVFDDDQYDNMKLSIFRQPVRLGWIPCDDVPASSTYAQKLRGDMQEPSQASTHWLWLCNKCNLPVSVSQIIMEYGRVRPNPTFEVNVGDISMSIQFEYYSCSSKVQLVARRKLSPRGSVFEDDEAADLGQ